MSGYRSAAATALAPALAPLWQDSERWYRESDLLIAALRDHIRDLRCERDRLLRENDQLRSRLTATTVRGFRPQR